jgi:hypothetical protein
LRKEGFELELTLKMEIGLRQTSNEFEETDAESTSTLDLTDDDLRTLRQMKIRIDE